MCCAMGLMRKEASRAARQMQNGCMGPALCCCCAVARTHTCLACILWFIDTDLRGLCKTHPLAAGLIQFRRGHFRIWMICCSSLLRCSGHCVGGVKICGSVCRNEQAPDHQTAGQAQYRMRRKRGKRGEREEAGSRSAFFLSVCDFLDFLSGCSLAAHFQAHSNQQAVPKQTHCSLTPP